MLCALADPKLCIEIGSNVKFAGGGGREEGVAHALGVRILHQTDLQRKRHVLGRQCGRVSRPSRCSKCYSL